MKEKYIPFFDRLNRLGSGERAALKRSAGTMLQDADGKAIAAFYRCLPGGTPHWEEERWFAAATLRCLWDAGEENGSPAETMIAQLIKVKELSQSRQHRVETLLDTAWDADGYMLTKLTRMIKLVNQKSDRAQIDFGALLDDLINWNNENQSVQRKWARAIFAEMSEE